MIIANQKEQTLLLDAVLSVMDEQPEPEDRCTHCNKERDNYDRDWAARNTRAESRKRQWCEHCIEAGRFDREAELGDIWD